MDTEVAGGMLNLSMGLLELLVTQQTSDPTDQTNESLSDDDQFSDMFKVPAEVPAPQDPPPLLPWLDPWALMAEAKFKSGHRTLPPPLGIRRQDVADTRNVILQSMQTSKKADTQAEVANPWNNDPLYLNRDASRDKALQTMQERCRMESRSSSAESRSSSGKHHRSRSRLRDEMGPNKGRQIPMEDWNSPGPVAGIARPTLNWSQDILEPRKLAWKPAAGDSPATPHQTLKSVVKMLQKLAPAEPTTCAKVKPWIKPALAELASCGRGRGRVIVEKLQELAGMGPAAASHYTSKERSSEKKPSKKPTFPTLAEQEEHKWHKEHKEWVVNHQEENIGERYISLKRQAHRYSQEIRALWFFQPDDVDLACQVLAIADWAEEHNQLNPHLILEIPATLLVLYSGSLQARGQFQSLPAEEMRVTDVRTRSQAVWIFLCSILQYYEDDMAACEGALYGRKTHQPSALVLYIMAHVNLGLPEHYRVQWSNIVGKTPWLTAWDHLSPDEFCRFYQVPGPDNLSELEQVTEDIYRWQAKDAVQRESGDHPIPPSHADEAETRNPLGLQPPSHKDKTSPQPPEQEDWPHKFQLGPDWHMVTPSKTGSNTEEAQPAGTSPRLDA